MPLHRGYASGMGGELVAERVVHLVELALAILDAQDDGPHVLGLCLDGVQANLRREPAGQSVHPPAHQHGCEAQLGPGELQRHPFVEQLEQLLRPGIDPLP